MDKLYLSEAIEEYNRQSGGAMTQRELAHRIGRTEGVVSKYANGHVMPSYATLRSIALALHTSVDALFTEPEPMQRVAS